MKRMIPAALALCSLFVVTQGVQARNPAKDNATTQQHHSGNGNALLLGDYIANCFLLASGAAEADTRNITVNGHSQQVVHLKARGANAGGNAFVTNLDTVTTVITSPINFSVIRGNARYLIVTVNYIPHGGSQADQVVISFLTPDTKVDQTTTFRLIDNGNGNYAVPLGTQGIPQGAQLTLFKFDQIANQNNCSIHTSDINHLQINRSFVGISADPASSCSTGCDGEGGGGDTE